MRHTTIQGFAALGALIAVATAGPAAVPASAQSAPAQPAAIQLESVVLAHGVKSASLFGQGDVTPVGPGTSFITTDLPYALVKVKSAPAGTTVTLRLLDPSGVAYAIETQTPKRRDTKPWQTFQFAAPLYILGTDLESDTGTWHFQVVMNGKMLNDTPFQWQPATVLSLPGIKADVDASPLQADLHWRYGAALALFNHNAEAVTELRNAIQLDQKYALYHITLGRVYEREGKKTDAMREFQAALNIHGSFYDAVFGGWAQAHLTRLKTAQ